MKKRIMSLLLVLALVLGMLPMAAATNDVAYVTIAVEGDLRLVRYPVALTDVNENGQLDIDDALYLAHNNDDADQYGGYASNGSWVSKLWGDTSGWFGYTLNGTKVNSAAAGIAAGDELYAWVYTDKTYPDGNPDLEASFDKTTASVAAGESVEVTLQTADAIANGADVAVYKVKDTHRIGAEVETDAVFDAEGNATVTFSEAGTYVITAAKQSTSAKAIVPPYCEVTVSESLASADVMYTLGTATGKPGDTVTVPVTVAADYATSMNSLALSVFMGDGLELVGATSPMSDGWDILLGAGTIEMMGGGGAAFYMPSGELLNLQIKISDDAQPGTYDLDLGFFRYKQGSNELSVVSAVNKGSITVEAAAAEGLTDVILVAPEGLTTEDGINYYGLQTFTNYTFGFTTVPEDIEVTQNWTFRDGGNNGTEGSGKTIKVSAWSAGTATLTLTVEDTNDDSNRITKTYYLHEAQEPEQPEQPEEPEQPEQPEEPEQPEQPEEPEQPEQPEMPFTITVNGEAMTEYTLGEVTDPYNGVKPLYTVSIPEGTTEVTLSWADGNNYTLSYYDANCNYFGFESAKKNSWTIAMDKNGDGAYDMLQIYDSGYGVPYWITFANAAAEEPEQPEQPEMPFTITVNGEAMTEYTLGEVTDPYNGVKPLYTVSIPEGTSEVTLSWADGNNYTLSYYDANCNYFGFESAKKNSWTIAMDKNGDGAYDMLQIYDSGYGVPYWITFANAAAEEPEQPEQPEQPEMPFTITVNGEAMTEYTLGEVTDPYNGTKPLYTVSIPEGTSEVTLSWADGNSYTLSYYDANCNYFGFESGMKNSWTIAMDKNGDGAYDMLQIYDSGYGVPYWITFANAAAEEPEEPEQPEMPFTITVNGEAMTEYTLGEVNDPYEGVRPLYTVSIPEGTTEVTLSWADGNSYTLSYYDANCNYFGFESGMKNSWTIAMDKNGDGAYDMLQIYDSGYGVPYWITFANAAAEEPEQPEQPEQPEMPFTITVNGEAMTEYTLGEVNDEYNGGIKPLYIVTIPEGTTEVTLSWADGNNYTLSYYDANCNLIGWEAGMQNSWTLPMDKNGDGAYDLIQIYDSGWGVPYWITFTSGAEEPEQPVESNVVIVGNAEAWPGDLIELSIFTECVENDTNVFGRWFIPTLALPDGWTVAGATAGADLAETVWELWETDLYGWCLNGTAENYYGAYLPSGELMKFQIQVAADAEAGEYTVGLASAKMMKDDWGSGYTGFELVEGTVTVTIPDGKTKLDAPVLTEGSVFAPETYIEITVPASEVESTAVVEYAISTDGENWSEWQTDNRFTEVEDGAKYYVRARYIPHNTGFYEASDASNVIEVTTRAFVDDPVIFTFGDVIGSHGETIYVPITLSHGFDGMQNFGTFRFCIEVNENLTLVEVADGSDLTDARFASYSYPNNRAVSLMCSGNYAEVPEGEVMLLEIKVHEDAVPGTYEIGLDQVVEEVMLRYTLDGSGDYGTWIDYPLNIQVVEGTITIKEPLTAPVLTDYTATDDTITITAPEAVDGATVQYAISADGETYGEWQTGNVFAGLAEEATYYVIARYVVEAGHEYADSYAGEPMEVKTVNPAAAYTLAEVSAKAGETVEVAVTLEHAIVKQAASFNLIPTAAEGVELIAAKAGSDLPESWNVILADGVVTVYTTEATEIPAGEIVILTYQVGEDTALGEYTITLVDAFTEDGNAFIAGDDSVLRVAGTVTAGKITVKNTVCGDLNGEDGVGMADLAYMRRLLAGWNGYAAELAVGDLNGDGKINIDDAIVLSRHLAGWQDYLELPIN